MSNRLLTARELAETLGVSTETVLRWTRRGELPAIRLPGGAIRYRETDLDEWLDAHSTAGASDREVLTTRSGRARREGDYSTVESPSLTTPPQDAATTEEDP